MPGNLPEARTEARPLSVLSAEEQTLGYVSYQYISAEERTWVWQLSMLYCRKADIAQCPLYLFSCRIADITSNRPFVQRVGPILEMC